MQRAFSLNMNIEWMIFIVRPKLPFLPLFAECFDIHYYRCVQTILFFRKKKSTNYVSPPHPLHFRLQYTWAKLKKYTLILHGKRHKSTRLKFWKTVRVVQETWTDWEKMLHLRVTPVISPSIAFLDWFVVYSLKIVKR